MAIKKKVGNMPKKLNFGCYVYDVITTDNQRIKEFTGEESFEGEIFGAVNYDEQIILISNKCSPQMKRVTLLHELSHIISNNNNIGYERKKVEGDNTPEEDAVDKFGAGFLEFIKRNPAFVTWLAENE